MREPRMHVVSSTVCVAITSARRRRLRGGLLDRLDDVLVPGAAAEVALEAVPDLLLRQLVAVRGDERGRRHNHARRAEAALKGMPLPERLLHRVQLAVVGETFDRRNGASVGLDGENGARLHGEPVEVHGARAALRGVAGELRTRESELVAQEVDEQGAKLACDTSQ